MALPEVSFLLQICPLLLFPASKESGEIHEESGNSLGDKE